MSDNFETKIAANGLRYTSKEGGSPFQDSACGSTLSCYKCGLHKPRSLGEFKHILGQQRFKCLDCVNAATK
ncbi:MAG: hypothetical protein ACKVOY_09485 [Burkholderiaceae bacterium]